VRVRVHLATKVGPHDDPRRSLEDSLRRLGTEYVDLVQLHEALERWEWQIDRLHRLVEERKALALGLCNATHLQIARALELAPLAAYQGPYNLFDRDVEERELPLCRDRGLAFLAYRPLASGLLAGGARYAAPPEFAPGDHRRGIYWFRGREFARRRAVIAALEPLAAAAGLGLPALALGWALARPGVTRVLAGARNRAQLDANLVAATRPLRPELVADIDGVVARAFRPVEATPAVHEAAASWGERERFIVERLDGRTRYETVAAQWTDRGGKSMVAAQIKVFVDQLRDGGLMPEE
jgi:aryl-alcohol dehydrogenase-like predicted oxidoreductase